jgi:hypothetical protein
MKKLLLCLLISATFILLIVAPFLIEKIILCEDIFPFNMLVTFSKETWFGFIASYLGAIGTVALGIIALYQNKKYKKLSDSSEERFLVLQTEIKNLAEKNVALIELNSKIERAKYFPILTNMHHSYWNMNNEDAENSFDFKNDAFVFSYRNINPEAIPNSLIDVFNQYHTFVFTLKNDGERTIRNFHCTSATQNGQPHELGFCFFQTSDIESGSILRCVYVTNFNIEEKCKNGEIESLSFKYEMENVIGEHFDMTIDLYFIPSGENEAPDYMMEFTPIHRV